MRQGTLVICCLISTVICSDWTKSKRWNEETDEHQCRSCKAITIDRIANCPSEGYFCEEKQALRALVLMEDSCHCQSIVCANRDWRLAVNGSIVDRHARSVPTISSLKIPVCATGDPFESVSTDSTGACSVRTFVCGAIYIGYNVDYSYTTKTNGKLRFALRCSDDGTTWKLDNIAVVGKVACKSTLG
ncbi:hypothetical protein PRIPAC_82666 [Pristionchus pacificus]|uniref:Uncharacterized protein n=1 Tax=Pristionchus pacificus TaxID=54126 RepID=A0A2A6CL37_PRIPA|nr:hypothetical protein PRIPAC_82666 [Pristionchus pacificus]|eukprot:PDM78924.1 hypothetical protein PRIPAC_31503 [Pristionchus pacificus]